MKKLFALLLALILGLFSTTFNTTDAVVIDTPTDTKYVEWAIGYHKRCNAYRGKICKTGLPIKQMLKRIALAPLSLLIGTASAESTPDERYWTTLAQGGTPEEARAAYNATDASEVKKPKARRVSHPKWASKVDPERIGFLSAEDLTNAVEAKRGWFSASKLNGFTDTTTLTYQWYKPEGTKPVLTPPKYITYEGKEYENHCSAQGGLKHGAAIYLTKEFLDAETNGVKNRVLLAPPEGLPMQRVNQIKALRFTACQPTTATMKQVIIMQAKKRVDKASSIIDGRPVVHVDVPNGYKMTDADEIEQALDDGGCIYGPKSGIEMPAAQFRNDGDMKCAGIKYLSKFIGKVVIDAFGRSVTVTEESIISTTNNHKSIKLFLNKYKNSEMTGEEAYQAWLRYQGGPDSPIYVCPIHPQNGRVKLGRQIFGKFSQLSAEALFKVVSKDLGKLAEMGYESGYKKSLQRKYTALRLPELANALNHPFLYQDTVKSYISTWHQIASGSVEVNGSLALAVIDPAWFDDVYIGGKPVDDPTAGIVAAGTVLFGVPNKEGVNPYIGKNVVLARFPQVKSGLPVVKIMAGAYASGIIVVSGRPGDMVLQDLDADLDGDKLYVIDEDGIVCAVELANKLFNFPHVIFSKWDTNSTDETLEEYQSRNAQWQNEESVGSFATHQFVVDEMVPLLEEGQDWHGLLRPTLKEDGEYGKFVTLEEIFRINTLLGVGGNMATDSGKLNHKPDAPEYITKMLAFRPMSQRDAHPNAPDSGFKKRHAAFLPDKYPGVGKNVLKRLYDMMMKYIPIEEVGKDEVNDFAYDEDDRIIPDEPLMLWRPSGFEPVPENVWKHVFGNELDEIKTSLVCYPNDVETTELNSDLKVFENADEGISMVTYFTKYASKLAAIESTLNDDKKGWTVAGRDTFGDNLIKFVQTAIGRKDVSTDDCLWLAYNALCQSFIGTQSQSRGTAFGIGQFLKLFEGMLIAQVCSNTGNKPPKGYTEKVSIRDSVSVPTATTVKVAATTLEITDEEPPFDTGVDVETLQLQLQAETVNEEPPAESVNVKDILNQLKAETSGPKSSWQITIEPEDDEEYEEE